MNVTDPAWNAIPEGDDVLAFIARLEAPEHAWVNAVGAVWGAEIAVARGADDESLPISGRVTLVSLAGPRNGPLMAVLARTGVDGVRVFGGRLVKARSGGVSLNVDEWRALPPLTAPEHPPAPARGAPDNSGDDEADDVPVTGDLVDHFVFGLCEVMVARGERLKIRDLVPPNKLREINVGPFKLLKPVDVDGKRVFKMLKR